jgi:hypothetical protein
VCKPAIVLLVLWNVDRPTLFLDTGLLERTRKLRLELATDFLQSDNANVLKIDSQCDLATRSNRQA